MAFKDLMSGRDQNQAQAPESSRPAAPPVAPRPARSVSPATSIDAGSELEGTLRCRETLRIDGRIKGEVHCEKNVIIGEAATVLASVDAAEVTIAGEVRGDISASRKITLEPTARVIGDLCTPGIVIEEGAKLEGRIMIGSEEKAAQQQQPRSKAPAAPAKAPPTASASV